MIYKFGDFELRSSRFELRKNGQIIKVEPQVFSLLEILVANRNRIVTKEEIFNHVWGDRIVSDSSLDSRVRSARLAIGDDGKKQRLIKTYKSRGVRFIADTIEIDETSGSGAQTDKTPVRKPNWIHLVVTCLIAVTATTLFLVYNSASQRSKQENTLQETQIGPAEHSIAVLQFKDLSEDADHSYFADGITEELRNGLAGLAGVKVISQHSVSLLEQTPSKLQGKAIALGVKHVLDGSVRRVGSTLRITVNLTLTSTGTQLWSKTYDRVLNAENVLEIQDDITRNVSSNLSRQLELPMASHAPKIKSLKAYEYYLRGRALTKKLDPAGLNKSVEYFQATIEIEPDYAPAYASLVESYDLLDYYASMPRSEALGEMKKYLAIAESLAPDTPEVLVAAARVANMEYRNEDALQLYEKALAANPNYEMAVNGRAYALLALARYTEALEAYDDALALDPLSDVSLANVAEIKSSLGDLEGALETARINLKWNGNTSIAHSTMASLQFNAGNYEKFHQSLLTAAKINPDELSVQGQLATFYLDIGLNDLALSTSKDLGTKVSTLALTGDMDAALEIAKQDASDIDMLYVFYLAEMYEQISENTYAEVEEYGLNKEDAFISADEAFYYADVAFILKQLGSSDADIIVKNLQTYYGDNPPSNFQYLEQLLGGIALHLLLDDPEQALIWLDELINEGHSTLALVRIPIFKSLTKHPDFPARLQRMEENAATHRLMVAEQLAAQQQ